MTDTQALRKARGAFFTPPEVSQFLCDWAIRTAADRVLEPSCGEASFLTHAAKRLADLGATRGAVSEQLCGAEIHENSASAAASKLKAAGFSAQIRVGDFFDTPSSPAFDAVIGNPPYVRYQGFSGESRSKALRASLAQGVRLNGLASSWAAFTVHAASFLSSSGRLAMVLPGELLSVGYAAQVRRFLLDRFSSVKLVTFEQLVFPGVLEEVVLLLAEGRGGAPCFQVYQAEGISDLRGLVDERWTGFTPRGDEKWTQALIPAAAASAYAGLVAGSSFQPLLFWGETSLGAVTGNNDFFALSEASAKSRGLKASDLTRISPPGSRHLRGLRLTEAGWLDLVRSGARCYLFSPSTDRPSAAARSYVAKGERGKVHLAYKCKARTPWWRVPPVAVPDLFMTYMDQDRPRFVANDGKFGFLNSVYGVKLRAGLRELGRNLLPIAMLNSVTMLSAELVGRSYGGGLLKLEPTEADKLLTPSIDTIRTASDDLAALRPQLAQALRNNRLDEAVKMVDRVLLTRHIGLSHGAQDVVRGARLQLRERRATRGRTASAND